MVEIIVNAEKVQLEFGYGVFRRLGEKWGIETVDGVFGKFNSFLNNEGGEMKFETINLLGDLLEAAAENAGYSLSSDRAVDCLIKDPEKMQEVVKAFIESLPVDKKKTKGRGGE